MIAARLISARPVALTVNRPSAPVSRRPICTRAAGTAAVAPNKNNASEARAWIEAWRTNQAKGGSAASPPKGGSAASPPKPVEATGDEVAFSSSQLDATSWEDALKKLKM
eukprot:jgi/Tetstr1/460345/TSEL_005644.t1